MLQNLKIIAILEAALVTDMATAFATTFYPIRNVQSSVAKQSQMHILKFQTVAKVILQIG